MSDKNLYKIFIVMFAVNIGLNIYSTYRDEQERKLRIEDLQRKGNGNGNS